MMQCLSLREEFIMNFLNGTKKKEFRKWRTNYRGEIYLHCSRKDASPDYGGFILAKGNLVSIKWTHERGGCYEWEISDVMPLPEKIRANGKMKLWQHPN